MTCARFSEKEATKAPTARKTDKGDLSLTKFEELALATAPVNSDSRADNILRVALDIGEGLLKSGAEIRRVEITIEKICKAYGAAHVEVFSINCLIVGAVRMNDGSYSSQNRRITNVSNHLLCLERYNALSRRICVETPDFDVVDEEIKKIKSKRVYPFYLTLIGHILASGGFALFFGGSIRDFIAAGIIGIVVALLGKIPNDHLNDVTSTLLTSFAAGVLSCLLVMAGVGENMDMVAIGTIMLLIPGLSLGNAMRDLLGGDTLAGTLKVVQACINAVVIAIGYAMAILLLGRFCPVPSGELPFGEVGRIIAGLISSLAGTVGFALIFKLAPSRLWVAGLGGVLTFIVYEVSVQLGANILLASFIAALFMALFSEASARLFRAPTVLFLFPCAIPIVPGSALYYSMFHLLSSDFEASLNSLKVTGQTVLGIALGLSLSTIVVGFILQASIALKKRKGNKNA